MKLHILPQTSFFRTLLHTKKQPLLYLTLRYPTLLYRTLHYPTLHYPTLLYRTLRYPTLRCVTLRYGALHYVTLHYFAIRYSAHVLKIIDLKKKYFFLFVISRCIWLFFQRAAS